MVPKKYDIKYYLKTVLKYSYHKGSGRMPQVKALSNKLFKGIFSSEVLTHIYKNKYIINIDECCFNRDAKSQYSWLPRSVNASILDPHFTGR